MFVAIYGGDQEEQDDSLERSSGCFRIR
jgi:hypothetical protein